MPARSTVQGVDVAEVVRAYVRAWHEPDEAVRRELLEQSWAERGVYADPGSTISGREALVEAITDFRRRRPGACIEVRSAVDGFDRHFRFVWTVVDASGNVLNEGIDVGRLDDDGRIESIIGFIGIVPPTSAQ